MGFYVSDHYLRKVLGATGLFFSSFLVCHLNAHTLAILRFQVSNWALLKLRNIYQNPVVEIMLMASVVIHGAAAAMLMARRALRKPIKKPGMEGVEKTDEFKKKNEDRVLEDVSWYQRNIENWENPHNIDLSLVTFTLDTRHNFFLGAAFHIYYILFSSLAMYHMIYGMVRAIEILELKRYFSVPRMVPSKWRTIAVAVLGLMTLTVMAIGGWFQKIRVLRFDVYSEMERWLMGVPLRALTLDFSFLWEEKLFVVDALLLFVVFLVTLSKLSDTLMDSHDDDESVEELERQLAALKKQKEEQEKREKKAKLKAEIEAIKSELAESNAKDEKTKLVAAKSSENALLASRHAAVANETADKDRMMKSRDQPSGSASLARDSRKDMEKRRGSLDAVDSKARHSKDHPAQSVSSRTASSSSSSSSSSHASRPNSCPKPAHPSSSSSAPIVKPEPSLSKSSSASSTKLKESTKPNYPPPPPVDLKAFEPLTTGPYMHKNKRPRIDEKPTHDRKKPNITANHRGMLFASSFLSFDPNAPNGEAKPAEVKKMDSEKPVRKAGAAKKSDPSWFDQGKDEGKKASFTSQTMDSRKRYYANRKTVAASESTAIFIPEGREHEFRIDKQPVFENEYVSPLDDGNENTERYSGLRLKNRLISRRSLDRSMRTRTFKPLSDLQKISSYEDYNLDWVTIGVIASVSSVRKSAKNGSEFCIMKLSDLQQGVINVILFDESFERHGKEKPGSVVAILNAKLLHPTEKNASLGLGVDVADKLIKIGDSADHTHCRWRRGENDACWTIIDKRTGEYCDFHSLKVLKSTKHHRQEFASGTAPLVLSNPGNDSKSNIDVSKAHGTYFLPGGHMITTKGNKSTLSEPLKNNSIGAFISPQIADLLSEDSKGARCVRLARGLTEKKSPVKKTVFREEAIRKLGFDPTTGKEVVAVADRSPKSSPVNTPTKKRLRDDEAGSIASPLALSVSMDEDNTEFDVDIDESDGVALLDFSSLLPQK
ncbi:minichromosome maintenance- protein [Phlyctochytrium planicorne]|nr:minichromosome maintenance- protein [Phlyctochytrium planicorne]